MNAHDMVQTCFRHQHPEAYGKAEQADAVVPANLRYGNDPGLVSEAIPEDIHVPEDARLLGTLDTDFEVTERERQAMMARAETQYREENPQEFWG